MALNKRERKYCVKCKKRTSHKKDDVFICTRCEMALEDKLKFTPEDKQLLELIKKTGLSKNEVQQMLATPRQTISGKCYNHPVKGHVRFGVISDTHIGAREFDEDLLRYSSEMFKQNKVKEIYHIGDILEGMSGRDGHIYELSKVGFSQQIKYTIELFKKYYSDFKILAIQGNHDSWYKIRNNGGIIVGEELQDKLPNFTYLGESEADIKFSDKVTMKLVHPGDGTAYAASYKMQKRIEALEASKKPNILLSGHYHKALYMFNRNIHGIECGTLCGQTNWMKGKNIPAHKGFWIVDFDLTDKGISNFTPKFFPAYD